MNNETNANLATETYLTQFHHDRGRVVIAVSPRRGEYGPLAKSKKKMHEHKKAQFLFNLESL